MLTQKRTWIGFSFIVVTFYFLFRNIDWNKMLEAFSHLQLIWILPALVVYLFGYIIRGFRWVILLSPVKKCTFQSLFPTLIIGFMANNVLPARAGEFIRAHLNGKKEGISRSASFATIVLERLFDGLTMIILLWIVLGIGDLPIKESMMSPGIQHAIDWSPYVFGGAFLALFTLVIFKESAVSFIKFFVQMAPKKFHDPAEKLTHTFIDGLHILKNARESLLVLLTSLGAWTCEFSSYYLFGIGMGIAPAPLNFGSAALLMAIVNLGILIPNAPGGVGLFELLGAGLLFVSYHIPKELAVGYMLLVHFMVLVPIILLGFYYSTREHLNLGRLEAEREQEKEKTTKRKARK